MLASTSFKSHLAMGKLERYTAMDTVVPPALEPSAALMEAD